MHDIRFQQARIGGSLLQEVRKQEELGHFCENRIYEHSCGFVSTQGRLCLTFKVEFVELGANGLTG